MQGQTKPRWLGCAKADLEEVSLPFMTTQTVRYVLAHTDSKEGKTREINNGLMRKPIGLWPLFVRKNKTLFKRI